MAIPLMRLLDQLADDPDQREAFAANPARALADAGWDDLDDAEVAEIVSAWAGATPGSAPSLAAVDGDTGGIDAFATAPIDVASSQPVEAGSLPLTSYDHASPLETFDDLEAIDPSPSNVFASQSLDEIDEGVPVDPTTPELDELDDAFGTGLDGTGDDGLTDATPADELTPDDVEPLEDNLDTIDTIDAEEFGVDSVGEDPGIDRALFDDQLSTESDGIGVADPDFGEDAGLEEHEGGWDPDFD